MPLAVSCGRWMSIVCCLRPRTSKQWLLKRGTREAVNRNLDETSHQNNALPKEGRWSLYVVFALSSLFCAVSSLSPAFGRSDVTVMESEQAGQGRTGGARTSSAFCVHFMPHSISRLLARTLLESFIVPRKRVNINVEYGVNTE
jgi:hypothetical protein